MKRINNLYSKICDIENIKLAQINSKKGKKSYKEVIEFEKDYDNNINKIQEMLVNKTFKNSDYFVFKKVDKGKVREIYKLPYFPDRIIQHAIMQVLEPIWRSVFIQNTYQSIKGRGVHKAKNHIEYAIRKDKPKYYLKIDIRKFYPSVNNEILKEIVRKKIKCKDTLWLLDEIIDSTNGLPIGNYLSQYLGNLYLSYFDHYIKETIGCKYYYRYCDDITILDNNKANLHRILYLIKEYFNTTLDLSIKGNYQISLVSDGIDFLGFRFFPSYTLLRKSIAINMKKAFKLKDDIVKQKVMASYYGWLKHCNGFNLYNTYKRKEAVC